jgi:hypothetical protein
MDPPPTHPFPSLHSFPSPLSFSSVFFLARSSDAHIDAVRKLIRANNISEKQFNIAALKDVLRDINIKAWRISFFPKDVLASVRTHRCDHAHTYLPIADFICLYFSVPI